MFCFAAFINGRADMYCTGDCIFRQEQDVFKVKGVIITVDTLKFSIRDSKYDFFYRTFKPLATMAIKKNKKAIKGSIMTGIEHMDGQLVSVRLKIICQR